MWPVREGQQFSLPVKLFGGGQLSRVSGGRYGQTFSEDAMPAKRGMVRALCAGAKEEEAAARARTHRSKGKKEREEEEEEEGNTRTSDCTGPELKQFGEKKQPVAGIQL
ncbi:hypothetical protein HPB50_008857 [Hyalomma asiaticum]|uniref:Uncharacterized protein n=1 Tax=Hyalomma asiaticum TaxID=266040 RepID=A0ACB7SWI3_HYAAI|nr:hypothetical protein HPB50_008857 [Hyalomma asiaticum]